MGPAPHRRLFAIAAVLGALATSCSGELTARRGRAALAHGDEPEAVRLLERALAAQPSDTALRADLARALLRVGRASEALPHAEAATARREDPETHLLLGQIRFAAGDREGAAREATAAAEHLRSPARLQECAILWLRLGRTDDAIAAATRAVERSGFAAAAYANLAVLAAEGHRPGQAEAAARAGVERHPKDVPLLRTLAAIQLQRKDLEGAAATYTTLLPLDPEPGLVHQALALVFHALGRLTDARRHSDAAVAALGHVRPDVHYTLVVVLRDAGSTAAADAALARARRSFPRDPDLASLQR